MSNTLELVEAGRHHVTRAGRFDALHPLSIKVARGEYVGITGPSGSGKSTLLNLIAGIDRPSSGSVHVEGADTTMMAEGALSRFRGRHIGVVFQFFALIPTLTAEENLRLAMDLVGKIPRRLRRSRARDALGRLGLSEHLAKLPSTLSGGEQQRVAIARALANDPGLIVADEPTGNLDSTNRERVDAIFASLAKEGRTVLVATHDTSRLDQFDRILKLNDGHLVGTEGHS